MKKIFILLVGLLVFFNSNAQWNLCDSSFQLYITNQTASEATVSSNQNVIGNSYSYVYFDMQFNCIGGTSTLSTPENLFIFGQNSILDSTIIYLGISDSLGITCYVIDTLVLNNTYILYSYC